MVSFMCLIRLIFCIFTLPDCKRSACTSFLSKPSSVYLVVLDPCLVAGDAVKLLHRARLARLARLGSIHHTANIPWATVLLTNSSTCRVSNGISEIQVGLWVSPAVVPPLSPMARSGTYKWGYRPEEGQVQSLSIEQSPAPSKRNGSDRLQVRGMDGSRPQC